MTAGVESEHGTTLPKKGCKGGTEQTLLTREPTTARDSLPSENDEASASPSSSESDSGDEDYVDFHVSRGKRGGAAPRRVDAARQPRRTPLEGQREPSACSHVTTATTHSKLFEVLQKGSQTVTNAVRSRLPKWTAEYNAATIIRLANLMLEAAGFPGDFITTQSAEGTSPQDVVDEAIASLDHQNIALSARFPLRSGDRGGARFVDGYRQFWLILVSEFGDNLHQLSLDLLAWVLPLSNHRIRNLRLAGSVAGFYIGDGLLARLAALTEESHRFRSQLDTEKRRRKARRDVLGDLDERLRRCNEQEEQMKALMEDITLSLMNVRWRDTYGDIRYEAFAAITRWMEKEPRMFLADGKKSRFLGWGLFDRDERIRTLAAEHLAKLLESPDKWKCLAEETPFLSAFLPRLVELPEDTCEAVSMAGLRILTRLAAVDALSDEQVEKITEMLWRCPSLITMEAQSFSLQRRRMHLAYTEGLAEFIDRSILSASVLRDDHLQSSGSKTTEKNGSALGHAVDTSRDALDLRSLLEFVVEFAEDYVGLLDVFVTGFWRRAPALRRIGVLVDFLTVGEASAVDTKDLVPLAEKYQKPLAVLLLSCFRHLELTASLAETSRQLDGSQPDTAKAELATAVSVLLTRAPGLLRVCKSGRQTEGLLMTVCCTIWRAANKASVACLRRADIASCIDVLTDTLVTCHDASSFDYLAAAIAALQTEAPFFASSPDPLISPARESAKHIVNALEFGAMCVDESDAGALCRLRGQFEMELRRFLAIAKSINDDPFRDHEDLVDLLLNLADMKSPRRRNETSRYFDAPEPSVAVVLICLQCLVLVYFHMWGDIEDVLEEGALAAGDPGRSPAPAKAEAAEAKQTDSSVPRRTRKRGRTSAAQEDLRSKRRRTVPALLEMRLVQLSALLEHLRLCTHELMAHARCPYVRYGACVALLELLQFRALQFETHDEGGEPLTSTLTDQLHGIARGLEFDQAELSDVIKYYKACLAELETVLMDTNPGPADKPARSPLQCAGWQPCIPIVSSLLDRVGTANEEQLPALDLADASCQRFIIWRFVHITHLLIGTRSLKMWESSLPPLVLTQLWFDRHDVNEAVTAFVNAAITTCDSNGGTVIWTVLLNTVYIIAKDFHRRQRLKTIVAKVAKVMPPEFAFTNRSGLLDLIANGTCGLRRLSRDVLAAGKLRLVNAPHSVEYVVTCLAPLLPKLKTSLATQAFLREFRVRVATCCI